MSQSLPMPEELQGNTVSSVPENKKITTDALRMRSASTHVSVLGSVGLTVGRHVQMTPS